MVEGGLKIPNIDIENQVTALVVLKYFVHPPECRRTGKTLLFFAFKLPTLPDIAHNKSSERGMLSLLLKILCIA